jgi:O-antigen biosynthesis protein
MAGNQFIRRAKVLVRHYREQGFYSTIRWLWRKVFRVMSESLPITKANVLAGLDFVALPAALQKSEVKGLPSNTLNWFIPPFGRGSGGHLNIFRFISNLEQMGFDCSIIIVANSEPLEDAEALRANIGRWFMPLKAKVYKGIDNAPPAHISLATEWRTAYYVRSFAKTNKRCYFVQDFEPWFFPIGTEYCLAEETYRFGFVGITAGGWLKEKLAKEFGMTTYSVGFSYDRDLYKQLPGAKSTDHTKRVFFYARPPTPRRAFELGLLALKEVAVKIPGVEIVLAGWDLSGYEIPFKHKDLGVLSLDALPEIYNTCSVALVLSLTNLSLLPLELMACGVPIVSNNGPNNEWLLTSENSKLTRPTPEDLAAAICEVLTDETEAARLIKAGFETANKTSWESEASKMANFLKSIAQT